MREEKIPPFQEGKVLWFNAIKGYGFIKRDNDSDLFVHFRDIMIVKDEFRCLNNGQEVRFRVAMGPRGEYAYNVFPTGKWFVYGKEK